jgi:hypothetical protein
MWIWGLGYGDGATRCFLFPVPLIPYSNSVVAIWEETAFLGTWIY